MIYVCACSWVSEKDLMSLLQCKKKLGVTYCFSLLKVPCLPEYLKYVLIPLLYVHMLLIEGKNFLGL